MAALLARLPGFTNFGEADGVPDLTLTISLDHRVLRNLSMSISENPHSRVLLLSSRWTPEAAIYALQAGAAGILTTDLSPGDLAAALRQASRDEIVLSPQIQRAIALEMVSSSAPTSATHFESLSEREQEVLILICQGLSNKQIAQKLYLSVRTVENHLRRSYQKLGVSSRTEAAVLAMQEGWVELD